MSLKNVFTELFAGALETAGESKLIEILQTLHDTHPEQYKAAIYGGHALTEALSPLVDKTKTKIDDAILHAIRDAVRISAANNGINDIPAIPQP